MKGKADFPGTYDLERELTEHIDNNALASEMKRKYNIGVAVGLAVIFFATAAFACFMIIMPENPSGLYWAGCGTAALFMTGALIVVPIRLKKLQAVYFYGAASAAEEYAEELKRRIRGSEK